MAEFSSLFVFISQRTSLFNLGLRRSRTARQPHTSSPTGIACKTETEASRTQIFRPSDREKSAEHDDVIFTHFHAPFLFLKQVSL